jgi:hypothetical protein
MCQCPQKNFHNRIPASIQAMQPIVDKDQPLGIMPVRLRFAQRPEYATSTIHFFIHMSLTYIKTEGVVENVRLSDKCYF